MFSPSAHAVCDYVENAKSARVLYWLCPILLVQSPLGDGGIAKQVVLKQAPSGHLNSIFSFINTAFITCIETLMTEKLNKFWSGNVIKFNIIREVSFLNSISNWPCFVLATVRYASFSEKEKDGHISCLKHLACS